MLKFRTQDKNVWFTSDPHFNHDKDFVYGVRGYTSCDAHREGVIQKWNESVGINDVVFCLGDFHFGADSVPKMMGILERLNFAEIYLLPGNHTAGFRQLKNQYGRNFTTNSNKTVHFYPDYMEIIVDGQPIVLCHYPIVSWNGQGGGSWHLFGHTHQSIYKGPIGDFLKTLRCMDVGIDYCGRPIAFEEMKELIGGRQLVTSDHHNAGTQNPF